MFLIDSSAWIEYLRPNGSPGADGASSDDGKARAWLTFYLSLWFYKPSLNVGKPSVRSGCSWRETMKASK